MDYLLTHHGVYETVNLGNNQPVGLLDLIAAIGRAVGVEPRLEFRAMQPGDVDVTYADISKARQLLGYDPQTNLDQGLRAFVDWLAVQPVK